MYKRFYLVAGTILILCSCTMFDKDAKTFVKSVKLSDGNRIDWYVRGYLSGPGPTYLQFSNNDKKPFFTSYYLSDFRFQNDSLYLSLWRGEYELDRNKLGGIKVAVDTLGQQWNGAEERVVRLRKRNVDTQHPHFIDVFCEKSGCE